MHECRLHSQLLHSFEDFSYRTCDHTLVASSLSERNKAFTKAQANSRNEMSNRLRLQGVRVHLSGAIWDDAPPEIQKGIYDMVKALVGGVLRQGGAVIHGSHPTIVPAIREAAEAFLRADGSKDSVVLARSSKFATNAFQAEIEEHRKFSVVEILPFSPGDTNESLVPMRDWMAERSDVIVCFGGKWYDVNKARAGVPEELDAAINLCKPAFVLGGFGGAASQYLKDRPEIFDELRNGISLEENQKLFEMNDPTGVAERIIKQLIVLPFARVRSTENRLFRILALDGGGIRGAFGAAVLAKWSELSKHATGNDLVKHFDLVAGTSTGAIIAVAMAMGKSPAELVDFYRTQGPTIFKDGSSLGQWIWPKHDAKTIDKILASVLKTNTISDSTCRLVIPTILGIPGKAELLVTPHSPDRTAYKNTPAVQIVRASTAAPTYFAPAEVDQGSSKIKCIDGGLWANNPVLPAIAEAVRYCQVPLDRIDVLSIGTTTTENDFSKTLGGGSLQHVRPLSDLFFSCQESGAAKIAELLLSRARHLRIDKHVKNLVFLDDYKSIPKLIELGHEVGVETFDLVRSRFLDGYHAKKWEVAA